MKNRYDKWTLKAIAFYPIGLLILAYANSLKFILDDKKVRFGK